MESQPSSHVQASIESQIAPFRSFHNFSEIEYTSQSVAQVNQGRDSLDNASTEFNYDWLGPMKTEQFVLEYLAKDPSQLHDRDEDDASFQRLKEVMKRGCRLDEELNNDLVCTFFLYRIRPNSVRFSV
jgi:hypothetical protein